jgi:hypothetical protein
MFVRLPLFCVSGFINGFLLDHSMVLHATADVLGELDAQFSAALKRHRITVSPEAQAYTVGVLGDNIRAADQPFETVTEGRGQCTTPSSFKQLGDFCLYLSGYFYQRAERGGFSHLHRQTGSSAYKIYSRFLHGQGFRESLFDELSIRFDDISLLIGDLHLEQLTDTRLLELLDRYQRSGSERDRTLLQAKGIMLPSQPYDA